MNENSSGEKNKAEVESNGKMNKAIASVIESFDIEIARLQKEDEMVKVLSHYMGLYSTTNLFSFFVPLQLTQMTEYFLEDPVLRTFMLNYTERVSMSFSTRDVVYDNAFLDTLVPYITVAKINPESNYSLINKEVLDSLFVNPEVLKSLLKDNFWLTVLYLLLVNFQLSAVFKASVKEA